MSTKLFNFYTVRLDVVFRNIIEYINMYNIYTWFYKVKTHSGPKLMVINNNFRKRTKLLSNEIRAYNIYVHNYSYIIIF